MAKNQEGFHVVPLLVVIVLLMIGVVFWRVLAKNHAVKPSSMQSSKTTSAQESDTPPLKLKSIGFNLDYYNPTTQSAGEMQFIKANIFDNEIWGDFGQQDPRTTDQTKKNPQPTYVLPLNVKVQSLVDGTVADIKGLYSGDVTIWVTANGNPNNNFIYETEHVINPRVKVGDHVKGGQYIADVSDHGSPKPGYGILEIGILHPEGTEAGHLCPYKYLDDSIKTETLKKITSVHEGWNAYTGQPIYDLSKFASPGCVTEDWVQG